MNLPNKITTFRMVMVGVIFILLLVPSFIGNSGPMIDIYKNGQVISQLSVINLVICGLFLIASFSDYFDGHLARKYNLVTTYGKFMDPIADKLLVDTVLLFFVLPMSSHGFAFKGETGVPMVVCILMIARDLVVDAIRLISMEKRVVVAANKIGKVKTVLQMIALTCVLLNNWPFVYLELPFNMTNVLCYLAGVVSLISGVTYLLNSRKVFEDSKDD